MTKVFLPVLYGSTRDGAKSLALARFVSARGALRPDVETRLFLPAELPFGNLVRREWEMDPAPSEVKSFVGEMRRADGFVVVTPEYNHGFPGALKNVLDHLYDEWGRKPFGLVGGGGEIGGSRALDALMTVLPGLGAFAVPFTVTVAHVEHAFEGDRPIVDAERLTSKVDRLWEEVTWYAEALREARPRAPKH